MARIRSIKPEFWQDELIATLPRDVRLLFIGLWTMADDEGRFRANPAFVKAQVFPYDTDTKVEKWLAHLQDVGRIRLYESNGQFFGWVCHFNDHQRIDKPKRSTLPEPPPDGPQDSSKTFPGIVQDASKMSPGRKGGEGKGVEGRGAGKESSPPPEDLQAAWNEHKAPEMPHWRDLTKGRKASAKERLAERPDMAEWIAIIQRLARSGFARGLIPGHDGKTWIADPEFLLRPDSATKVLEGKYDDRGGRPRLTLAEQIRIAEERGAG